jgi:hypothetical protein
LILTVKLFQMLQQVAPTAIIVQEAPASPEQARPVDPGALSRFRQFRA